LTIEIRSMIADDVVAGGLVDRQLAGGLEVLQAARRSTAALQHALWHQACDQDSQSRVSL
jgi:hypothetical protein